MGRKSREKRERRQHDEILRRNYRDPAPPKKYPSQPLASAGLTDAERDLAKLCRATFLSTWSYPNVQRAEVQPNGGVIAKEVCDLLVVFEEHVVIFSDKDCVFPVSGVVDKDWSRWYRRAIEKSALQLYGAERVIRARTALFLDSALKTPIPLPLPDLAAMKVHRVLVAHGACARCRAALGGSGTLMIKPDIVGPAHITPQARGGSPFAVGQVNPAKGYIHVLDDAALVLLLRTLDTAADLIAYLSKKEILVTSGRLGFAAGEEALLGWYLATFHSYKYAGCTPCNSSLLEFVTLSRLRARAVFARFEPARIAIANMSQPTAASGALRWDRVRHECDKNGQEELNALRCRNRRNASPEGCCAPILTEVHSGTRLR